MAVRAYRRRCVIDVDTGGPATISGVVRVLTAAAPGKPVYLLRQDDMRVRRETRSGADGVYSFQNIAATAQWLVVSIDPDGAYNAVVADRVVT